MFVYPTQQYYPPPAFHFRLLALDGLGLSLAAVNMFGAALQAGAGSVLSAVNPLNIALQNPLGLSAPALASLDMAFQDVSGISVEMEPETVAEGGLNTYRHKLPVPPKYSDLVLKRGLVTLPLPLFVWCKSTIQNGFSEPIQPKTLLLFLLGPPLSISVGSINSPSINPILQLWMFYGAWPTKWNVSDLNSEKNEVVIETLQFTYRYFTTY